MEQDLKQFLVGMYRHIHLQQQMLAEFSNSTRAMIHTLKARDPQFWAEYQKQLQATGNDAIAQGQRSAIQVIESVIQGLQNS